ncbi:MAG: pyridoxamine 5'-phosphate oxidase [Bdellovibrio sp.]|nr:pyridoxamine 5'-phosphate oxidase [Bdellovibrio sp.]
MARNDDPIQVFLSYFEKAKSLELPYYDAMTLATATREGKPSARVVLFKGIIEQEGITFYTNYQSRKGKELLENPQAACVFYWPKIECQIRFEGQVKKLSDEESNVYWKTRPRDSQLGGVVSQQSQPLKNRFMFLKEFLLLKFKLIGKEVARPQHWGGYALTPNMAEVWLGKPHRLHRRFSYRKDAAGWYQQELYP